MIRKGGMKAKKVVIHGFEFHSQNEAAYYEYLIQNKESLNIKEIELQHTFDLIPSFKVVCFKCNGSKKVKGINARLINCKRCKGNGEVQRRGMSYTPDFIITYNDDTQMYVDVKNGRFTPKEFPYYKKIFEWRMGIYLVIATYDGKKKEWVYK